MLFKGLKKQHKCEHNVVYQALCDKVFDEFKKKYDYLIRNNIDTLTINYKCDRCYRDFEFAYQLLYDIITPVNCEIDSEDRKRLTHYECGNLVFKCKFMIKYDNLAESLDEKTIFLIKIHGIFAGHLKDTTYLHIKKNYAVTDIGITLLEGEVSNITPLLLTYEKFKYLYLAFTKEFNKDVQVILER